MTPQQLEQLAWHQQLIEAHQVCILGIKYPDIVADSAVEEAREMIEACARSPMLIDGGVKP
jgi:hypothetical protein